ncbi:MAG: ATP synthase subunit alpha [Microgenomates group bacterium GW2011_GWD1_47_13]|nr:MAG: ATP synthase subunit alpha [Microgenomates group bacterium GW2011_GWD1_47_13]
MTTDFQTMLRKTGEVGYARKVIHEVVEIEGLPGIRLGETVMFETGQIGQTIALNEEGVEVLVLSVVSVRSGTKAVRTGEEMKIEVGDALLGKTVDVLGKPVDGVLMDTQGWDKRALDVVPRGIGQRQRITRRLVTGASVVDQMVPIGKGQRELVMGDRKTGKSQLLMQTLICQANRGNICVYAAIGKKKTEILKLEGFLKENKVADRTVLVATSSHESAGQIFLCPYTAMTVAEHFRDQGKDVLVILDDMSAHAQFYRELSLLSRKFPGRDSYPGDIFHVHSKLLERAGNFKVGQGEASITCLPVVETVMGDITGYIQTNLMSMTDGHIYFDSDLFYRGRRPAINPFVSVTRVGRQTQSKEARAWGQRILTTMSEYSELKRFLRFGTELTDHIKESIRLAHGLKDLLKQNANTRVDPSTQLAMLEKLWKGKS